MTNNSPGRRLDQEFDVIKSPEGRRSGAGGTRSVDDLNLITRRYESLHWMGHTTPRAGGEGVCQDTSKEGSETCALTRSPLLSMMQKFRTPPRPLIYRSYTYSFSIRILCILGPCVCLSLPLPGCRAYLALSLSVSTSSWVSSSGAYFS